MFLGGFGKKRSGKQVEINVCNTFRMQHLPLLVLLVYERLVNERARTVHFIQLGCCMGPTMDILTDFIGPIDGAASVVLLTACERPIQLRCGSRAFKCFTNEKMFRESYE